MDAALAAQELISEAGALIERGDFEGAEEVLSQALTSRPEFEPVIHRRLGQLYVRWNKLTSALNHLSKAAELAHMRGDLVSVAEIAADLSQVKRLQADQRPF